MVTKNKFFTFPARLTPLDPNLAAPTILLCSEKMEKTRECVFIWFEDIVKIYFKPLVQTYQMATEKCRWYPFSRFKLSPFSQRSSLKNKLKIAYYF